MFFGTSSIVSIDSFFRYVIGDSTRGFGDPLRAYFRKSSSRRPYTRSEYRGVSYSKVATTLFCEGAPIYFFFLRGRVSRSYSTIATKRLCSYSRGYFRPGALDRVSSEFFGFLGRLYFFRVEGYFRSFFRPLFSVRGGGYLYRIQHGRYDFSSRDPRFFARDL